MEQVVYLRGEGDIVPGEEMLKPNQSRICKRPDLCLIACPYNRILSDLGEVVCEPPEPIRDDAETAMEVVFDSSEKTKESP